MITDSGDITDESFNQITWETVCAYGDANGVEYEYYKPAEDTDEERINSIDLAVSDAVLEARCKNWVPRRTDYNSGAIWRFARNVGRAADPRGDDGGVERYPVSPRHRR